MAEYIEREAAIEAVCGCIPHSCDIGSCGFACSEAVALSKLPASDVVSRGAYDKTDWERCVALTQLKEIGKGLGERMDDVRPVVRGKWEHFGSDVFRCSECGYGILPWNVGVNFCPNCGAMMEES